MNDNLGEGEHREALQSQGLAFCQKKYLGDERQ